MPSTSNSPPLGEKDKKIDVAAAAAVAAKGGEPWYKEVVELRKQANEFRVSDDASNGPRLSVGHHLELQ